MTKKIQNPHDKLFRETWSNLKKAKGFLENYLPREILKIVGLDSLEICKDSFIEKELRDYYSDMLYKVSFSDETGYIYFLFEHKSYPESLIHLQLLEYMIKIWRLDLKQNRKLSIIIPLVLYHSSKNWKTGKRLSSVLTGPTDSLKDYLPDFEYILYDLSKYSDNEIKGTILARVVMLLFKHIYDPDFPEKLEKIFMLVEELSEQETGLEYFQTLLKYIINHAGDVSPERFKTIVEKTVSKAKGEMIMTLAEQLKKEGRKVGRKEGLKEGRKEAAYKSYFNIIRNMKENNLSDAEIAQLINLEITMVQKIVNNEKVDIPLHLLDVNE